MQSAQAAQAYRGQKQPFKRLDGWRLGTGQSLRASTCPPCSLPGNTRRKRSMPAAWKSLRSQRPAPAKPAFPSRRVPVIGRQPTCPSRRAR